MANIVLTGDTSGSITVAAPAVAGTNTLTLPASTSTLATTADVNAAGKVLQVVQTVKSDIFTTTSNTFVDVTGFNATITPSSTSSKILILARTTVSTSSSAGLIPFNLLRGSTNLCQPDTTPLFNGTTAAFAQAASAITPATINFLDSPSTTSATTYKIQLRVHLGTCLLNGRDNGASSNDGNFTSTLTLMEVAA